MAGFLYNFAETINSIMRRTRWITLVALACLVWTACVKQGPMGRHESVDPPREVTKLVLSEQDWIRYVGREDYVNENGVLEKVEHFHFTYTGNNYFVVRIIRPEDFESAYANDAAEFFQYEVDALLSDAKSDGVAFYQYTDEVFTSVNKDILFNRLRHGTWIAFMFELSGEGSLTGNYAETTFTVEEEVATEAFRRWLGDWRVSNGLVGYDLTVTSLDNNYLYAVDGWERGPAVAFQMDQEHIEAEFWAEDGCMYICSQFLGSYEDTDFGWGTVDELFMGNIFDSNGITLVTDEGIDLAVAVMEGENATLSPCSVTLSTGSGDYTTTFHSMQYYMWAHKDGEWHPYNENVAQLPLTMERIGTRSSATEQPLVALRPVSRASIHHQQMTVHRGGRKTVARKFTTKAR